jgi:hypothetical protein
MTETKIQKLGSSAASTDLTTATYVYNTAGTATSVMGTSGNAYVLYIDSSGTIQTDLATN